MKEYVLLLMIIVFIPCCSSSRKAIISNESDALLDYNIEISQGGGFTGNYQGYTIDSTGVVKSFEGVISANSQRDEKGKLSQVQISEINKLIPSILGIRYKENGNMTTSIVLKKRSDEIRFSWEGITPGKKVPAELANFYEKVNNIITKINK